MRAPQAGHQAGARRGDLQRAESAGAQRRGAVAVVRPGAGAAAGVRPRLVLPLLHRAEQARHLAVPGVLLHQRPEALPRVLDGPTQTVCVTLCDMIVSHKCSQIPLKNIELKSVFLLACLSFHARQ